MSKTHRDTCLVQQSFTVLDFMSVDRHHITSCTSKRKYIKFCCVCLKNPESSVSLKRQRFSFFKFLRTLSSHKRPQCPLLASLFSPFKSLFSPDYLVLFRFLLKKKKLAAPSVAPPLSLLHVLRAEVSANLRVLPFS